jgi:prephenate dehydratase
MADDIRKVDYYSMSVSDKPGEGLKLLTELADGGVKLLALTAFPRARRSQVDFVPEDSRQFTAVAKKAGWKVNPRKTGFLIQGEDRTGALLETVGKLMQAGINITAMDAVTAGAGRYGAIFWVKPESVAKASKVLGATAP